MYWRAQICQDQKNSPCPFWEMAKFDFHTCMANEIFMGNSLNKLKNSANKLNFLMNMRFSIYLIWIIKNHFQEVLLHTGFITRPKVSYEGAWGHILKTKKAFTLKIKFYYPNRSLGVIVIFVVIAVILDDIVFCCCCFYPLLSVTNASFHSSSSSLGSSQVLAHATKSCGVDFSPDKIP